MNLSPVNDKVPWKVWDAIYIMVLVFFLSVLLSGIVDLLGLNRENLIINILIQITLPLVSVLCIYFTLTKHYKVSFLSSLEIIVTRENIKKYIFYGILISFIIFACSIFISIITYIVTSKPLESPYKDFSAPQMQVISLLSIMIAPFFEEIFFRGFMQPAACKAMGNIPGVFFVALIFTFIHSQYQENVPALLIMIALSLVLGFSKLYFKSTVPCIVAHLLNNVYASLFLLLNINA